VSAAVGNAAHVEHAIEALPADTPGRAEALQRGYVTAATLPLHFHSPPTAG
jgi:hypothetical protein